MEDKIANFISTELTDEQDVKIAFDEDLLGSGLIESMAMMRLIQFVEDEFEVKVEPQEMTIENFITVNAISSFIKRCK